MKSVISSFFAFMVAASATAGVEFERVEYRCSFSALAPATANTLREQEGLSDRKLPYAKLVYEVALGEAKETDGEDGRRFFVPVNLPRVAFVKKGYYDESGEFIVLSAKSYSVTKTVSDVRGIERTSYKAELFHLHVISNSRNGETRVSFEDGGAEFSAVGNCSAE